MEAESPIVLTNYERVRDGDIDPRRFTATSLDEASVLRDFGSKTYQTFLEKFRGVQYKLVCTATPSPNRYKELIHYAGYLEVMDTGQALTRFFQRDSSKAGNLQPYPHKEEEFWLWVLPGDVPAKAVRPGISGRGVQPAQAGGALAQDRGRGGGAPDRQGRTDKAPAGRSVLPKGRGAGEAGEYSRTG